jgi:trans-2,3-dihydro-3-hydroxyanthranilate isomerase
MARNFAIYDVFTDKALSGNGLAVVFDSEGLDTAQMLAIAREFNQSETVFVAPAVHAAHSASLRIFTPNEEMPFAGHPTVGTAIAITEHRFGDSKDVDAVVVLEEKIGPVRCGVVRKPSGWFAEFDVPKLPVQMPLEVDTALLAAALDLDPQDVGFENHVPSLWSAGVAYCCVPVRDLDAAARARATGNLKELLPKDANGRTACPYVYCRETQHHEASFHARMFAPWNGIPEDPATGSAAAAFIGAVHHFDQPHGTSWGGLIEQGVEMGRPSLIALELELGGDGALTSARIGGHAVKTAEGLLLA